MLKWLQEAKPLVPPQSLTGKALGYMSDHWEHLTRYLEDGGLEIDNNGVENAIRPIAIGRKNWLFNDTVRGAQASANLYSLIETAKANGLEPLAYLTMLFRDLPHAHRVEDYERLLPTRWTNERVRESLAQSTVPV
jgi:transposase